MRRQDTWWAQETSSPLRPPGEIPERQPSEEHRILDDSAKKIVEAATKHGAKKVVGPVPLPTEKQVVTILRAVHKYKYSREQFEIRTHKRLIEIVAPSKETIDSLQRLDLPSGVDIEIKL